MKEIMIWSDYACPFCYIGEKRLQDALDDLGLRKEFNIVYRAFELDRDAPREISESTTERIAKKYNLSIEEAAKRISDIDKAGNEAGLVFRYVSAKPSNTLDAHRLMKLAEDKYGQEVAENLNRGLFEAYFTDSRRLSDHEVLMQVGVNAGMPTEEISRVLNSKHYTEQVRHDENEAAHIGVHGVPFIVFNGHIAVPGALSTEDFKKVIREVINGDLPVDASDPAQCCDESGCHLS